MSGFEKIKRIAVKLSNSAQKKLREGHPWIFENSITKQSAEASSGDLAIIYDNKKNKFLGFGLFDIDSVIRIKMLQFLSSATFDRDWLYEKIEIAYKKRVKLYSEITNSYRLIYGENDFLPGLITDVFDKVAVIKLYSAAWLPYLEDITDIINEILKSEAVVLRLSRNLQKSNAAKYQEGMILSGNLNNEEVIFQEHGVKFCANVIKGHKTGFFLDHRHNRNKVGKMAKGKTMLDVFSYAGGFSVHALANNAKKVVSVDISKKALELAERNATLNAVSGEHITIAEDAFLVLEKLAKEGEQFDVIVIDPPSFAKSKEEVARALLSYKKLALFGIKLVKNGGTLVMASCSSRVNSNVFFETVETAFDTTDYQYIMIEQTYHDIDHPINFPEGAYLKCAYYKIIK